MELNKIHNMDCLEGLKQMDSASVDLIVTDPPFNIGKKYLLFHWYWGLLPIKDNKLFIIHIV